MTGIDDPPPFWGRWSRIYWLVAGWFAALVLGFWLLSRWAS
jgi:hypothetical protein